MRLPTFLSLVSSCFIKFSDHTSLFAKSGMSGIQLNRHAEEREERELKEEDEE